MKQYILVVISIFVSISSIAQSNTARYYQEKASKLINNQEYEKAFITLSNGINLMPDSAYLYETRGTLLDVFSRYQEAIQDYNIGISKAKNPKLKSHMLSNRGGVKQKIRNFNGAYEDLILSIQLDSTNINALNNLATVCREVDKKREVVKYLEKIISIDSGYVPAYVNLGFEYQVRNKHKKAIKYFNTAIELSPEEPLGYSNRSFSKLKLHDLYGAINDINRSIKLFSSNSYAYKIRALIEIENGNRKKGCKDLKTALKLGYKQQYGEEVDTLISENCMNPSDSN